MLPIVSHLTRITDIQQGIIQVKTNSSIAPLLSTGSEIFLNLLWTLGNADQHPNRSIETKNTRIQQALDHHVGTRWPHIGPMQERIPTGPFDNISNSLHAGRG